MNTLITKGENGKLDSQQSVRSRETEGNPYSWVSPLEAGEFCGIQGQPELHREVAQPELHREVAQQIKVPKLVALKLLPLQLQGSDASIWPSRIPHMHKLNKGF